VWLCVVVCVCGCVCVCFFLLSFFFFKISFCQQLRQNLATTEEKVEHISQELQVSSLTVSQTRSLRAINADKELQERFNLAPNEVIIEWFRCTCDGFLGHLYILPSYIIFESNALKLIGPQINHVILIRNIESINKIHSATKVFSFIPGKKGSAAEFKLDSGKTYTFGALMNRKETLALIIKQATNIQHNITTLRDGTPEEFDMQHTYQRNASFKNLSQFISS